MPMDDWYDVRFDPYMQAVGKIAIMWAALEYAISQAIWELCNVEAAAGACITAQLIGPGPRIRAFISLIDFRAHDPQCENEEKLITQFNKLAQRIEAFGRQRNSYIHHCAVIGVEKGDIKRLELSADRRLKFDYVPADLEAMEKLAGDIRQARIDFDANFERVLVEFSPWPRTQFEQSNRGFRSLRKTKDSGL
jgi:hypothetical protein